MEENSDWLEVLDPDDPPLQAEGGDGGPPHSQTKAHTGRLKSQRIIDIVEAGQDLRIKKELANKLFCELPSISYSFSIFRGLFQRR